MRTFLLLIAAFAVTESIVDFSFASLYDIYDFQDSTEVEIPRCYRGCVMFASTLGKDMLYSLPDTYAQNLIIVDRNNPVGTNMSLYDLSQSYKDNSEEKKPLVFTGLPSISIINTNEKNARSWSLVLYVVEKNKADTLSYHVYDSTNLKSVSVNPNGINTVMSAAPFTLIGERGGAPNSVTARLVGFDNALNTEQDGCPIAFQYADTSNFFAGFNLQLPVPIISLLAGYRNPYSITANTIFVKTQDLSVDRFAVSPGYNGCSKSKAGGIQNFRSPLYEYTDIYSLDSQQKCYLNVTVDAWFNLDENSKVTLNDEEGDSYALSGLSSRKSMRFNRTKHIDITFSSLTGNNGFLLRHQATTPTPTQS